MSLDTDLTADVSDELFWDPKVDNAAIAVSATEGKITLRGTVGSLREKREAKKAAQRAGAFSLSTPFAAAAWTIAQPPPPAATQPAICVSVTWIMRA